MTYMVQWDGVKVADDRRTLSILHTMRPGAVVTQGCGTCASCTGIDDVLAFLPVESFSSSMHVVDPQGNYGLLPSSSDYYVSGTENAGVLVEREGTSWVVSDVAMSSISSLTSIQMAPWYHESNPATGDFYGAIVTDMQGALDRPTSAKVLEGLQDGGWITGLREGPREIRMKMTLMAGSEAGLNAGLAWIAGTMEAGEDRSCTSGVTMRFGVSCPGEAERLSTPSGDDLTITDRQLVSCHVIDGPKVTATTESCGLWTRQIEVGILSGRGKLMRPTMDHLNAVAGTSGPGVVVQTISSAPALCPPDSGAPVMRDPASPIPAAPVPPAESGSTGNRTTFSHAKRVTVPIPDEPWVSRAIKVTLHATGGTSITGARVRIFPTSMYTPCGEAAEFYVQYIRENYALVVDGIEGSIFAWRSSVGNWAQASHLVRSIYSEGYFLYPLIEGSDGFYVVVESQGSVDISIESAAIE